MAESSIKHPKHAAANEGPGTPRSSQKAACRTSSIHEKASVLLKSARLDLKTALERVSHPVEANDHVVSAKSHIKEACSLLPSLRMAHGNLHQEICRSASPCPSLHRVRDTKETEQGRYEINKLLQLVQEALDWVACNKEHYDKICQA